MNILCIEKQMQLTAQIGEIFPYDQVFHISQLSELSGFEDSDLICFDLRGNEELFSEGALHPFVRSKKKAVIYEDAKSLSVFDGKTLYGEYIFIPLQKLSSLGDFFPSGRSVKSPGCFAGLSGNKAKDHLASFSVLFRQALQGAGSPLETLQVILEMIGVSKAIVFKEEKKTYKWVGMLGPEDPRVKLYQFREGHPLLELLNHEQQFVGVADSIAEFRNPEEPLETLLKTLKMTAAFLFSSHHQNYLIFLGHKDSGFVYSPDDLRYVKQMLELLGEKSSPRKTGEIPASPPVAAASPLPSPEGKDYFREFSYRTTNELKNALVSIKTFIQLFPDKYKDVNFRNDFYQVILQEVARLENISDTLGFFGGDCLPNFKNCKISSLAEEAWKECFKQFPKVKKLNTRGACPDYSFEGDERLLKRALLALLTNAAEAMQGNGIIDFTWSASSHGRMGELLEIRIADSGPGIDPEKESMLFEPFYSTKPNGLGLGLTFASKIIESHGGTLNLNKSTDGGTVAVISIPQNLKSLNSAFSKSQKKESSNV